MRDDNLFHLMLRDADEAPQAHANADLRRGQRRLRRRRASVAVAAAACGVLAASVTAYGVNGTTGMSGEPASHHDEVRDPPTEFLADLTTWEPAKRAYLSFRDVVFDHTAYGQHGLVPPRTRESSPGIDAWGYAGLKGYGYHNDGYAYYDGGTADKSRLTNIQWERPWKEGSSKGMLRVELYGPEETAAWDSDEVTWMSECDSVGGLWPHQFPSCEERTTPDGETVLVGIDRGPVGIWMRANWKQPDGTFVGALFFARDWPGTQALSLTMDDLTEVATDPRLAFFDPRATGD